MTSKAVGVCQEEATWGVGRSQLKNTESGRCKKIQNIHQPTNGLKIHPHNGILFSHKMDEVLTHPHVMEESKITVCKGIHIQNATYCTDNAR